MSNYLDYLNINLTDEGRGALLNLVDEKIPDWLKAIAPDGSGGANITTTKKTVNDTAANTRPGMDPKTLWIIGGSAAAVLALILIMGKKR